MAAAGSPRAWRGRSGAQGRAAGAEVPGGNAGTPAERPGAGKARRAPADQREQQGYQQAHHARCDQAVVAVHAHVVPGMRVVARIAGAILLQTDLGVRGHCMVVVVGGHPHFCRVASFVVVLLSTLMRLHRRSVMFNGLYCFAVACSRAVRDPPAYQWGKHDEQHGDERHQAEAAVEGTEAHRRSVGQGRAAAR